MHDDCCTNFQNAVDDYLVRHRSILDVLSKYQESAARVNRSFAKAVTECGCVKINAARQQFPSDASYCDLKEFMSTHLSGELCDNCKETISTELGHCLFYLTALCNLAGLKLNSVIRQELTEITALGYFHLS